MDRELRRTTNTKQDNIIFNGTPSLSSMAEGQVSIGRMHGERLSLYAKSGGQLWKVPMTADGSQSVDKSMNVKGEMTLNDNVQINDKLTIGYDDTGYDVKFFGATSGKYMLWDESADKLIVTGTTSLDGAVVINDSSADVDFRIEGNGEANLLFCDAGNDRVGIGTASPAHLFHATKNDSSNPVYAKIGNHYGTDSCVGVLLSTSNNVATDSVGAEIRADRTDVSSAGDSDLFFKTSAGTTMTNRMILKSNGGILMGDGDDAETHPSLVIHAESPSADDKILKITTTSSDTEKFSVDEDGDTVVAGDLDVAGSVTGKTLHIFFSNFTMSVNTENFLPFNSVTNATAIDYRHKLVMPYAGELVKVVARSQAAMGTTVFKFYKAADDTHDPTASGDAVTVSSPSPPADRDVIATFGSDYTFAVGDVLSFSIDPTNSPGGDVNCAVVLKFTT